MWLDASPVDVAVDCLPFFTGLGDSPAPGREGKPKDKPVPGVFRLPGHLEPTADQQAALDKLVAEYGPELEKSERQKEAVFTPEQKAARDAARRAAHAKGLRGPDANAEVEAAVKLTAEQQAALAKAKAASEKLEKEIREKVMTLLTAEQKELAKKPEKGPKGPPHGKGNYDAIVLDWMLPQLDGLSLLRRLRDVKRTPVLILTARDATSDKVRGLNAGADDYLAKPFALEELLARLRAPVRRAANHPSPQVRLGDLCIHLAASRVLRQGVEVALTAKEYALLELLVLHRGRLVTRRMIYDRLYDEWDETLSNTVEVYVASLRRKLGPEIIQTRRGQGYLIRD